MLPDAAVVVLALYLHGDDVAAMDTHPCLICALPLMSPWVSRPCLKAHRAEANDDPVVYAIKARGSFVILAMTAASLVLAEGWG